MLIPNFLTPVQAENLKRTLMDTFEYRLHVIKVKAQGRNYVAHIYDGTRKVFETHGVDSEQALRVAKAWIDEQDEVTPTYDLHQ